VAGKLVVEVASEAPTLSELLQGVTEANLHSEWKTGPAVGKEIW
jgi:antitoxin component of MazEF toxin-antitoxin module